VARTPFHTAEALVIVSTDGYFDVFASAQRKPNERPAYRGTIAELGPTVRGPNGRLSVRPDSTALANAVAAWSKAHGAAAVGGSMGGGRDAAAAAAVLVAARAASQETPKPAAPETSAEAEKPAKPAKADKADKAEKTDKAEKPAKAEKLAVTAR
jgi:hypothetical protein